MAYVNGPIRGREDKELIYSRKSLVIVNPNNRRGGARGRVPRVGLDICQICRISKSSPCFVHFERNRNDSCYI